MIQKLSSLAELALIILTKILYIQFCVFELKYLTRGVGESGTELRGPIYGEE